MLTGTIYRATGGFYSVYCPAGENHLERDADMECRARGIFRKEGRKPLVGDRVEVQVNDDGSGTIDQLLPRKNELIRPPLANLDYMVVVLSVTDPAPNLLVVDKYLAVLEHKDIEPLIAITKSDLQPAEALESLYRGAGYTVFITDTVHRTGVDPLSERLADAFSAFSGNTGVGKTSLLNAIDPGLGLAVGDTSKKLGRGKHTTRHVETYRLPSGGLVADTPGFTSLEIVVTSDITKQDLGDCFREFAQYSGKCKFQDCSHTCEKGCAVLAAVERGEIAKSRHQNYCLLYDEIKEVKEWERK